MNGSNPEEFAAEAHRLVDNVIDSVLSKLQEEYWGVLPPGPEDERPTGGTFCYFQTSPDSVSQHSIWTLRVSEKLDLCRLLE